MGGEEEREREESRVAISILLIGLEEYCRKRGRRRRMAEESRIGGGGRAEVNQQNLKGSGNG